MGDILNNPDDVTIDEMHKSGIMGMPTPIVRQLPLFPPSDEVDVLRFSGNAIVGENGEKIDCVAYSFRTVEGIPVVTGCCADGPAASVELFTGLDQKCTSAPLTSKN